MALYLITGLPGTGKSTVCEELKSRGTVAYDGDYDRLAQWFSDQTGKPVLGQHVRTPEFLKSHSRNISRGRVEYLRTEATDKPVFLCADPENEDELADLFTTIFALVLDEGTRQHRLTTRTNNKWGKLPHEIEYDQAIRPIAEARYMKPKYRTISADQTTDDIVDIICRHISNEIRHNS